MSIGPEIRMVVSNMRQFRAELIRQARMVRGAGETAVKVEGFRLMKLMKQEMLAGGAGGRQFEPLREISSGRRDRTPLIALARKAVRYRAMNRGAHLQVMIGFLYQGGSRMSKGRSSHSWVRIAERQQAGYSTPTSSISVGGTTTLLKSFIRRGASMKKGNERRKYFFLRKSTKELKTPARPVIEPFWAAHEREAERNIISNFNRKLAGERI